MGKDGYERRACEPIARISIFRPAWTRDWPALPTSIE
jgi:hypothetical protein